MSTFKTEMTVWDTNGAVSGRKGMLLSLRVEERSMLDPFYDTDPLLSAEVMNEWIWDENAPEWLDALPKMDKDVMDQVLAKLNNQFCDLEATRPNGYHQLDDYNI